MSLNLRWVGEPDFERVVDVRLKSYASGRKDRPRFETGIKLDQRARSGDYLLAERDGVAVGTSTSLSMTMWCRGAPMTCQGVAFVGTVRNERRKGKHDGPGLASVLMQETLSKGRQRGQVVSALMPFRASFYEHFGYGIVEHRAEWTVPMQILPAGDYDGIRYASKSDVAALCACRQRITQVGQCDIETAPCAWDFRWEASDDGFMMIDQPDPRQPAHGWMYCQVQEKSDRSILKIFDAGWDSIAALKRQLSFLAAQRDQYWGASLTLPTDLPLNHLLRESQIPHRVVQHAAAEVRPYTRMQVRILDHLRFFEKQTIPPTARGSAVIAVRECEGTTSKFKLDCVDARISAQSSEASPDVECSDVVWASIACGEISATTAAQIGLITVNQPKSIEALEVLSHCPTPFCGEYF